MKARHKITTALGLILGAGWFLTRLPAATPADTLSEGSHQDTPAPQNLGNLTELFLAWPNRVTNSTPASAGSVANHCDQPTGSTHELTYDHAGGTSFWITGQNYDHVARVGPDSQPTFFDMGKESGPHGIEFDKRGRLWVSLEFSGFVVRLNKDGGIEEKIDVRLHAQGAATPINTHPHGLGIDADGKTVWFTGKKTNTVGKINPDGSVEHFELPTVGAVPIYIAAGPDGNMWCTELVGNMIARITPKGEITEVRIPTYNSRPIAIVPGPDGKSMWFSEEAGHRIARIELGEKLTITEFLVPQKQNNMILAGLAFDSAGNLWTQSYIDPNNPLPEGSDQILKLDKTNFTASGQADRLAVTYYEVPTRRTIMHRITPGPDGNLWFTELGTDKVGKIVLPAQIKR
jgi:virginiamycin B lyase